MQDALAPKPPGPSSTGGPGGRQGTGATRNERSGEGVRTLIRLFTQSGGTNPGSKMAPHFPWSTITVNLHGSFAAR